MGAAELSERSCGLTFTRSEFYSYLCSGHCKSILSCLTLFHLQDLHLYADVFFIAYSFLSHHLCVLHLSINVILIIVKGLTFHATYFRFL